MLFKAVINQRCSVSALQGKYKTYQEWDDMEEEAYQTDDSIRSYVDLEAGYCLDFLATEDDYTKVGNPEYVYIVYDEQRDSTYLVDAEFLNLISKCDRLWNELNK